MFVPGPVDVDAEVLQAQTRPMLPHRSKEFEAIYARAADKSRQLFLTTHRVFLAASSGTGLQEAAVRNFVEQKVLMCVNGAFAERWHEVALSNGKQAGKIEFAWDEPIEPARVAEIFRSGNYEALSIVHNETSTDGNPVREVVQAALIAADALIVDAKHPGWCQDRDAGAGYGADFIPKMPRTSPGLALGAVSDRAMQRLKSGDRGWYFDLVRMEKHRLKDSTSTPAMSLSCWMQLDRIWLKDLNAFARHAATLNESRNTKLTTFRSIHRKDFVQDGKYGQNELG
jgi:aspartate aminotransferase-like enzyme